MRKMARSLIPEFIFIILTAFLLSGCSREKSNINKLTTEDSARIVNEIIAHRTGVDSSFRVDPQSPFVRDTSIRYTGIKWFPPDLKYYFASKLRKYEKPETVEVYGTKGDASNYIKYGYFKFEFDGKTYKLNAYKFADNDPKKSSIYEKYLSVWFTDETIGRETYNVGRYIEVGDEDEDTNHIYTLNFNNAYNPYCAYSALYSCVRPRKEDHLPFAVNAGEKKYHD
jgi:uncharacterized protein (DUF1684 family)